jgi:hypothetical protein
VLTATPPNGSDTTAINSFNSLANMVQACMANEVNCATFLTNATPVGGTAPTDTFEALGNLGRHPFTTTAQVGALYDPVSLAATDPFSPTLQDDPGAAPDAWTLAVRFIGDGVTMDGPGNIAIDHLGNVWVSNNYTWDPGSNPDPGVCGSDLVMKLTPTGRYAPGSPYSGGGLSGVGFGIDIDPYGDVWLGNFGFAAPTCPDTPPHNSVSQFRPDGTPVSGPEGYVVGGISWPQATVSDAEGNIWVANCSPTSNSVTRIPKGDPALAQNLSNIGLDKPFGIDFNNEGDVFVTGNQSNNVAILDPNGVPTPNSPTTAGGQIYKPMGIAADSQGNMWVANSGLISAPCPATFPLDPTTGSVTLLGPDGSTLSPGPSGFTGGGITIPWGIAVDGADNVWIANFGLRPSDTGTRRLSKFCGVQTANCPAGHTTGEAISPDGGYSFNGLVRNTGVAIDPSGNVWLTNNWKNIPIQANPGGYEMVAYVGLAAPVNRPAPIPRPAASNASPAPAANPVVLQPTFTG